MTFQLRLTKNSRKEFSLSWYTVIRWVQVLHKSQQKEVQNKIHLDLFSSYSLIMIVRMVKKTYF